MPYPITRAGICAPWYALAILIASAAAPAHAHLHWSRTNSVGPETAALYHVDTDNSNLLEPAGSLSPDLGLSVVSGAPAIATTADTPGIIFAPAALALPATQTLRSTKTVTSLNGDITIECWFKWNSSFTSGTLEVGLQSGARILVARDVAMPPNDRFGVAGTHGSYIPAPGFTNWPDVGEEEASLNEWRHLALAIHSNGIHYDPLSAHDVYSTGTVGRLYLNGHPVGFFPHMIDLAGLKVHDASRITIMIDGGQMALDEIAVWRRDWSGNGTVANPFADGRGPASAIDDWHIYSDD